MHTTTQLKRPPKNSTTKLEVKMISKAFTLHNRDSINVAGFSEVSFSVNPGSLLALTGSCSVGKSSILKAIFRACLIDSGNILFHRSDGGVVDLARCSESRMLNLRRREIGFVTRFLKILPRITALQAVAAPLIELGENEQASLFLAGRMLDLLGIREELFHVSPLTFSGGERQRVNIARGVIAPKELILLDEPMVFLDDESSILVLNLLQGLKKKNIAMIAIFHDKVGIDQIADNTYEVCRGVFPTTVEAHWEAA